MGFQKKTWKNRVSDYPTRRLLTPVGEGDAYVVEIERNEGTITEEGDPFNAATMNDLENRIEAGIGAGTEIVATLERTSTASKQYTAGKYLVYQNTLYRVTSTINQGASIVPGTNCTEEIVGDALARHQTAINSATSTANSANSRSTTNSGNITNLQNQLRSGGTVGTSFYFDYKDGKYGWNSSSARGADTFHPFGKLLTDYTLVQQTGGERGNPVNVSNFERGIMVSYWGRPNGYGAIIMCFKEKSVCNTMLNIGEEGETFSISNVSDTGLTVIPPQSAWYTVYIFA